MSLSYHSDAGKVNAIKKLRFPNQVTPISRESLVSLYPSSSSHMRLADVTYDHALLQVMEEPSDIGPEEEGDNHRYDRKGNLPK
jgi:hypothetical protein